MLKTPLDSIKYRVQEIEAIESLLPRLSLYEQALLLFSFYDNSMKTLRDRLRPSFSKGIYSEVTKLIASALENTRRPAMTLISYASTPRGANGDTLQGPTREMEDCIREVKEEMEVIKAGCKTILICSKDSD